VTIAGTDNDEVYKSERNNNMKYEIPVPIGTYFITLHFAEIFWKNIGDRVFDVLIHDCVPPLVESQYDIVKAAGAPLTKTIIARLCAVDDGSLSIELNNAIHDMPKLSGIEVVFTVPHLAHSVSDVSCLFRCLKSLVPFDRLCALTSVHFG
jgi:Malectin domain